VACGGGDNHIQNGIFITEKREDFSSPSPRVSPLTTLKLLLVILKSGLITLILSKP